MRIPPKLILVSSVASLLTIGAAISWRVFTAPHPALEGLATSPDLSRWPREFEAEVNQAIAEVKGGDDPVAPLGRLATIYFANDLYPEAEQALRTLRRLDSSDARWAYFLAILLSRQNKLGEAERLLRRTVEIVPDYAPARFQLGQLLAQSGRDEEAVAFYEQRLAQEPGDVLATLGLVDIERRKGRHDAAAQRLEKLLELRPSAAEARLLLAEIFDTLGQPEIATAHRTKAQRQGAATPAKDPWLDEAYLHSFDPFRLQTIGVMRLQAGAPLEALPYLKRAASLAPEDGDVQDSYATALIRSGRTAEAMEILTAAWSRTSAAVVGIRLADLLFARGETASAETLYQEAITRRPDDGLLYQNFGRLLLNLHRYEEARAKLTHALKLQPTLTEAQLNLGRALYSTGKYGDARAAILRAVEMRPDWSEALIALAEVESRMQNWAEVEGLLNRVEKAGDVSAAWSDLVARVALAKAAEALAKGQLGEAEMIYRRALTRASKHGALHGALAALLGKMNRLTEAQGFAQRYVDLSPTDAKSWFLLGVVQEQLGNAAAAYNTYTKGRAVAQEAGDTVRIDLLEQALLRTAPR